MNGQYNNKRKTDRTKYGRNFFFSDLHCDWRMDEIDYKNKKKGTENEMSIRQYYTC